MHEMICCLLFCLMFLTLYHFSTFVLNSSSWSFKWQDEIIRIEGNVSDIQRPKRIIFDRFLKEKGGEKPLKTLWLIMCYQITFPLPWGTQWHTKFLSFIKPMVFAQSKWYPRKLGSHHIKCWLLYIGLSNFFFKGNTNGGKGGYKKTSQETK